MLFPVERATIPSQRTKAFATMNVGAARILTMVLFAFAGEAEVLPGLCHHQNPSGR